MSLTNNNPQPTCFLPISPASNTLNLRPTSLSTDSNPLPPPDLRSNDLPSNDLRPNDPQPADLQPELQLDAAQPTELAPTEPLSTPVPAQDPPWSLWDVLAIALVSFGATTLFGLITSFVAMRVYKLPLAAFERNPKLVLPPEFAGYLVTLGFMVLIIRARALPFWRTIRWRWTSGIPAYAGLGFLLSIFVALSTAVLPIPKQLPIEKYFADTVGTWMLAIFGVTVAPLMEELFFRGFLYPALARRLGIAWSVVITAAGFALMHSPQLANAWAPLLLLFIVGVVLTVVRARTGSVLPGFFLHAAYNLTIFTELYFETSHFHNFEKLGG